MKNTIVMKDLKTSPWILVLAACLLSALMLGIQTLIMG